ncbi:MAG: carbamoyltransferase HypF [Ardenticatenaceae bacterium]|nr:carbamoyltransferase HypF [Ardenticatenaceae bacterium]
MNGIVQGVGFRPFVFGLAERYALAGWVRNTSAGVDIEVDGTPTALDAFVDALTAEAPPLAQIDDVTAVSIPANGFTTFAIVHSEAISGAFQPISPDVSICEDCRRELGDPHDRRYRYPFINCTNCGPRFTIIQDIPYDRPLTTMAPFAMCPDCRREYEDPHDRRFHAQPVACPVCGPQVWLEIHESLTDEQLRIADHREEAIQHARRLLAEGKILAVKGLGGFHLACDAFNETAVSTLRTRKLRRDKPFALMMPDIETIAQHCYVNEAERELLLARERPIVLLYRRPESPMATAVAPGQDTIGVMLPYTPLHYLLFHDAPSDSQPSLTALVMTSGNLSEEPIAYSNDEARSRLASLADAFLLHDRDIHTRCDDSVMRVIHAQTTTDPVVTTDYQLPLRRSRGYAPFPVKLPWEMPPTLAAGAELKNTFCITNGRYAFLSHHIGDMENYETLQSFEQGVAHFERLFRVTPELIAYDMHPNYLASRYALARAEREGITAVSIQHHHAHIAAVMAENGHRGDRPVIGVSFDGTGYGDDGAIWGGEFLVADYGAYERPYHLVYTPLPGGDKAIREPWRLALTWLHHAGLDWSDDLAPTQYAAHNTQYGANALDILKHQLTTGLNAPPTSSMGRLFDAVAALVGVRATVNYEAQAAIELEALADPTETGVYPFAIQNALDPAPLMQAILADLRAHTPIPTIAARFHNSVAHMVRQVCADLRARYQINEVALSGGVWQNVTLLQQTVRLLQQDNFTLLLHSKVPPNDGGLALGQAAIAYVKYAHKTR